MRQVSMIPGGCYANRTGVVTDGNRFIYCSSFAIYVYRLSDFFLERIISEYEKNISSFSWNPHDRDKIVVASKDSTVTIWHLQTERSVQFLKFDECEPELIDWNPFDQNLIAISCDDGDLRIWNLQTNSALIVSEVDFSPVTAMRYSPRVMGLIACGHEDNSVSFYDTATRKCRRCKASKDRVGQGVLDLQWDPLSDNYILVSFDSGDVALFDYVSLEEMRTFERQSGGMNRLSWIRSSPGTFLASSSKHGVVREWNVSQVAPKRSHKVSNCGLISLVTVGDGSHPKILFANREGCVGLYLAQSGTTSPRHMLHAHVETIFHCSFKNSDCNILASCSFDHTVRLWNVQTNGCVEVINPNSGIIYGVAWGPAGTEHEDKLAIAMACGKVIVWDTIKNMAIVTWQAHPNHIFSISWQGLGKMIATAGLDSNVAVYTPDGRHKYSIKHPDATYGCHWNPFDPCMLATGCADSFVRVFVCEDSAHRQETILKGHSLRVFNVAWSPLLPGYLASTSDDRTCRVRDIKASHDIVLAGHLNNVRGCTWHTELPHMIITGSWDASIRLWDIRSATCIRTIFDHHTDVYCTAVHPARPFFAVSSSRDSTMRFWSLVEYVPEALLLSIFGYNMHDTIIGDAAVCMNPDSASKLCGAASKNLAQALVTSGVKPHKKSLLLANFFLPPNSVEEFFAVLTSHITSRPSVNPARVKHACSVVPFELNKAANLEAARAKSFSGVKSMSKEESLRASADMYARVGRMRNYCDIMVEIGEWDAALAAAPAVSLAFWRDLAAKRAEQLVDNGKSSAVPLFIASGLYNRAVDVLLSGNEFDGAVAVCQAAVDGDLPVVSMASAARQPVEGEDADIKALRSRCLDETVSSFLGRGQLVLAAAAHLAVDDFERAMETLISGNELELALLMSNATGATPDQRLYLRLAARAERLMM
jgi:WD40 repeat protein